MGPRNAYGKDSITWDSGNMASSSGSWYAESGNRKKNTCPANINLSKKWRYVEPKQKTRQRGIRSAGLFVEQEKGNRKQRQFQWTLPGAT